MQAKSIKGKSTADIKAALEQNLADGFKPTLAIAFISKSQDRMAICGLLDAEDIVVFGCTTNCDLNNEEPDTASAAIILMDMNPHHFKIYLEEYPDRNYREVAKSIAQKAKAKFKAPAFLIGISNASADGDEILRGIEDVAGSGVNAFGGAAGDDYSF